MENRLLMSRIQSASSAMGTKRKAEEPGPGRNANDQNKLSRIGDVSGWIRYQIFHCQPNVSAKTTSFVRWIIGTAHSVNLEACTRRIMLHLWSWINQSRKLLLPVLMPTISWASSTSIGRLLTEIRSRWWGQPSASPRKLPALSSAVESFHNDYKREQITTQQNSLGHIPITMKMKKMCCSRQLYKLLGSQGSLPHS